LSVDRRRRAQGEKQDGITVFMVNTITQCIDIQKIEMPGHHDIGTTMVFYLFGVGERH